MPAFGYHKKTGCDINKKKVHLELDRNKKRSTSGAIPLTRELRVCLTPIEVSIEFHVPQVEVYFIRHAFLSV